MQKQTLKFSNATLAIIVLVTSLLVMLLTNDAVAKEYTNFSPLVAMSLFTGCYFKNRFQSILFTLLLLVITDLYVMLVVYQGQYGIIYGGWYIKYGIFIGITLLARLMLYKVNTTTVLLTGAVSVLGHWLISNFTVWLGGGINVATGLPLQKSFSGILQCYYQALPFLRNLLVATMVYSGVMFGIYEYAKRKVATPSVAR